VSIPGILKQHIVTVAESEPDVIGSGVTRSEVTHISGVACPIRVIANSVEDNNVDAGAYIVSVDGASPVIDHFRLSHYVVTVARDSVTSAKM
jgi:hypothetical protein